LAPEATPTLWSSLIYTGPVLAPVMQWLILLPLMLWRPL
jgi:hypothetical protein